MTFTETACTFCYIRLQLAALHFNEQAGTQQGELRYEILFPKFKRGGYTVRKKILIVRYWFTNAFVLHTVPYNNYCYPSTTGYLDELILETICQSKEGTPHQSLNIPDSLCSGYQRPDKVAAVSQHQSRFNLQ